MEQQNTAIDRRMSAQEVGHFPVTLFHRPMKRVGDE
jgi:hypothetical protein